jgi:uncharacterized RDD family membrane protein YckC
MSVQVESSGMAPTRSEANAITASNFDAAGVRAPFSLRCGAILIDYILLAGIIVASTIIARILGGGARLSTSPWNFAGVVIAVGATTINFLVLPWTRGYTVGKWATGLRIVGKNGGPISLGATLLRHVVGYPLSALPLGTGFLLAAFTRRGRALHDYLAGTMVVVDN